MFGFSLGEVLFLAALALIVIGPKQLPEVARNLARFLNDLKRATEGFTDDLKKQARIDFDLNSRPRPNPLNPPPSATPVEPPPIAPTPSHDAESASVFPSMEPAKETAASAESADASSVATTSAERKDDKPS